MWRSFNHEVSSWELDFKKGVAVLHGLEVRENPNSIQNLGCLGIEEERVASILHGCEVYIIGTLVALVDDDLVALSGEHDSNDTGCRTVAYYSHSHLI